MKIATYNVNGINGRLAVLLRWLKLTEPEVVCLQELKTPGASFRETALRDLGCDAIWHGQARTGSGSRQMTIEIRVTIIPPDRAAFPDRDLGAINCFVGLGFRCTIAAPHSDAHCPANGHQFMDQAFAHIGFECRVARPSGVVGWAHLLMCCDLGQQGCER